MAKKEKRPRREWSKEAIKKELRVYHEKGSVMSYGRMQKIDSGLVTAAVRRFGSWNNALAEAGIPIKSPRRWSEESVKKELRALHQKGHVMSSFRMKKIDSGLVTMAVKYFGGWNNALAEAGVPLNSPPREWSKEAIRKELRAYHEEGCVMSYGRMQKTDCGLTNAAVKYFGGWNDALTEAGIPINRPGRRWSKESVREELLAYHEKGYEMCMSRILEIDGALVQAARRYYGSWNRALIEVGVPIKDPRRKWSREKVLKELAAIMRRGGSLNSSEIREKHVALYAAANKYFKDYREAVESLGLDYSDFGKRSAWTKEEVIEEIKKLAMGNDPFTPKWVIENRNDLYMAARNKLGGWKNAVEAAGIDSFAKSKTAFWTLEKVTQTIRARVERGKNMDYAVVEKEEGAAFCAAAERHYGSWQEVVRAAREGLDLEEAVKKMKARGPGRKSGQGKTAPVRGKSPFRGAYSVRLK